MTPHIKITPQSPREPGEPTLVTNDRIEFVDETGAVTDISSAVTAWSTRSEMAAIRKVTLELLTVDLR